MHLYMSSYKELQKFRKEQTVAKNNIKKKTIKYDKIKKILDEKTLNIETKKKLREELFYKLDDLLSVGIVNINKKINGIIPHDIYMSYVTFLTQILHQYNNRKKLVISQLEFVSYIKDFLIQFRDSAILKRKQMERNITENFLKLETNFNRFTAFSEYYYHIILVTKCCITELNKINKEISKTKYNIITDYNHIDKLIKLKKKLKIELSVDITEYNLVNKTDIDKNNINIIKEYIF